MYKNVTEFNFKTGKLTKGWKWWNSKRIGRIFPLWTFLRYSKEYRGEEPYSTSKQTIVIRHGESLRGENLEYAIKRLVKSHDHIIENLKKAIKYYEEGKEEILKFQEEIEFHVENKEHKNN